MEQLPFVFTVFFMLLGPVKLIGPFAATTRGADRAFKRGVAIRATLIAAALCSFVALAGGGLLVKYHISMEALRIAGGLVLLISALQVIFQKTEPPSPGAGTPSPLQLAASPVAVPGIVPPAGVAAILIAVLLAPDYPGMGQAIAIGLATMMVLDFLVMYFIDPILKTPGLAIVLTVLGSVLVFVQACLALQVILLALQALGIAGA